MGHPKVPSDLNYWPIFGFKEAKSIYGAWQFAFVKSDLLGNALVHRSEGILSEGVYLRCLSDWYSYSSDTSIW